MVADIERQPLGSPYDQLLRKPATSVIVSFSFPFWLLYTFLHPFGARTFPVLGHKLKLVSSPFNIRDGLFKMLKAFFSIRKVFSYLTHRTIFIVFLHYHRSSFIYSFCFSKAWTRMSLQKFHNHFLSGRPFRKGVGL